MNWTKEEIDIIINNYNIENTKKIEKLLPNRSLSAIFKKAMRLGLTENKKWSETETNMLKKYYPTHDVLYCANLLNKTKLQVYTKAYRLKLINHKIELSKIKDIKPFYQTEFVNSYSAYILGFLWADGHLDKNKKRLVLGINIIDGKELLIIFNHLRGWTVQERSMAKYNWKDKIIFTIHNPILHSELKKLGFLDKSNISPCELLKIIPEKYIHYFFRGLIDGDGCFYYNEKNSCRQLTIASTYEQDWTYLIKLCNKLNIKYRINKIKKINKKSGNINKHSQIRILGSEIIKFGDYIYFGDKMGLSRKYNKFLEIKKFKQI